MKYRTRTFYTEKQKSLMWDRWSKGDSLHTIASLFDRHHPSISRILGLAGGIRIFVIYWSLNLISPLPSH
ncbi:MAG: hypothetical protein KAJ32_01720 [Gammaproteobacteria bacterium]|nr:hypothetical protein [Gammaproteobacteria bacterium]